MLTLAIAGGHQTSTAVVLHKQEIIGCVVGESLNLHTIDHIRVANRLGALVESLANQVNMKPHNFKGKISHLTLALAGAATEYDQRLGETCLLLNGFDKAIFEIVDDTWAGLIAGAYGKRGICAFAGTGASIYVGLGEFSVSRTNKIDGWGPILGDFGSGFQLAVDTCRHILRATDQGIESELNTRIRDEIPGVSDFENLQNWFDNLYLLYPGDWRLRFARIAEVVLRHADDKNSQNSESVALVSSSAEQLSESVIIAQKRFLPDSKNMAIVLHGRMFGHSHLYREVVRQTLMSRLTNNIIVSPYRTIAGAVILSSLSNKSSPNVLEIKRIAESIKTLPNGLRDYLMYSQITE